MSKARTVLLVALAVATSIGLGQAAGAGKMAIMNDKLNAGKPSKLNHSDADVTVFFEGLLALCLDGSHQVEVGALRNPHHELAIQIKTISGDHTMIARYPTDPDQDIWIEADNRSGGPVSLYRNYDVGFSRADNKGDPEDFRWVADLEGNEFHDSKLNINRPEMLRPHLHVTGGTFYTAKIFDQLMALTVPGDDSHWTYLGKFADIIAADMSFDRNGGEIVLRSGAKGSNAVRLTRRPGTRYEIAIRNTRQHPGSLMGPSDFHFWYDALGDGAGRRFDLRNVVELKGGASPSAYYLDGSPQICLPAFLSRTRSLSQ